MKTLKLRPHLVQEILEGKKTTPWRLFDDKSIGEGDHLSFVNWESGKEFVKAIAISTKETVLGRLTEEDWDGHERFSSEEEMCRTYAVYYKRTVDKKSPVKIIRFRLL